LSVFPQCTITARRFWFADRQLRGHAHTLRNRYPAWARPMIDLGTLAGLFEHDHKLAAYCLRCGRWSVLPLPKLVAQGKGSLRLPIRVRCRDCGEAGRLQVRQPVPTQGPGGWMEAR
jgi:hypothetical protein